MNGTGTSRFAGVGRRCCAHWQIKVVGILIGMGVFFAGYLWLLKHPFSAVTTMPVVAIDRLIPFQPGALVFYISLWIYVPLAVVLLESRRELFSHGLACAVLSLAGFAIFFFRPTAVPSRANDWAAHPGFSFLQSVDATGNACPSLHVAFAVLSGVVLGRVLREINAGRALRMGNWIWCAAILYSTVATRQHVVLDVAAGVALALAVVAVFARRTRRAAA